MERSEPRPQWRQRKMLAILSLFGFGLLVLVILPIADAGTTRAELGADFGPAGLLRRWSLHLVFAFAIALLTITLFELLSMLVQWLIWSQLDRRAFDQFFGDEASDRCRDGQLWVEVTTVASVLGQYGAHRFIRRQIERKSEGRLYKARDWVSRYDALAARAFNIFFRDIGLASPAIRTEEGELQERASPFVIYMGLTDRTGAFLERATKGWLRHVRDPEVGDAVVLLAKLLPNQFTELLCTPVDASPFCRLAPNGWSLDEWLGGRATDYAIILRHTDIVDRRREVKIVVAGFTELGTAAAGEYLTKNWERLWRENVRGHWKERGRGDFLLVLRGPSHVRRFSEWEPVRDMKPVTPERLQEVDPHLATPWVERLHETRRS